LNVYINIGAIKDEAFAKDRQKQLEDILSGMDAMTEEVYEIVRSKL
jgi:formiminotetrahydrofolate cyclodeaminase